MARSRRYFSAINMFMGAFFGAHFVSAGVVIVEFSKKILITNWVVTLILSGLVAALSIVQIDCTEVSATAALSWAALAVDQGFYSWKAKNENRIKLTKSMVKSWADEYGIEAVTSLAEIVLKE